MMSRTLSRPKSRLQCPAKLFQAKFSDALVLVDLVCLQPCNPNSFSGSPTHLCPVLATKFSLAMFFHQNFTGVTPVYNLHCSSAKGQRHNCSVFSDDDAIQNTKFSFKSSESCQFHRPNACLTLINSSSSSYIFNALNVFHNKVVWLKSQSPSFCTSARSFAILVLVVENELQGLMIRQICKFPSKQVSVESFYCPRHCKSFPLCLWVSSLCLRQAFCRKSNHAHLSFSTAPRPTGDASAYTSVSSLTSKYPSIRMFDKSDLITSNASRCSLPNGSFFYLIMRRKGSVLVDKSGMKLPTNCTMPKKLLTSATVDGARNLLIAEIFSGEGLIPLLSTTNPRISMLAILYKHFS